MLYQNDKAVLFDDTVVSTICNVQNLKYMKINAELNVITLIFYVILFSELDSKWKH